MSGLSRLTLAFNVALRFHQLNIADEMGNSVLSAHLSFLLFQFPFYTALHLVKLHPVFKLPVGLVEALAAPRPQSPVPRDAQSYQITEQYSVLYTLGRKMPLP